jgi:hypothetical protein
MQKKQHLATTGACTGVHLHGAATRRDNQPIRQRSRQIGRAIAASTIDQHNFDTPCTQSLQGGKLHGNRRPFVQHGDDD